MPEFEAIPPAGGSLTAPAAVLRLRFAPELRDLVAGVVGKVHDALALDPEPPKSPGPTGIVTDSDPELLAAWREGLRDCADGDAARLVRLVSRENFGAADVPLTAAVAESLLRACVQVRLRLRHSVFRDHAGEELDEGLEFFHLPPAEQQAYACYRLLTHLEVDLLLQLDPSLAQA